MHEGGVHAVHATICYHENFRETIANIEQWNRWFETWPDLIFQGRTGDDVRRARKESRTAIFFGFQNPSPIEDDIGLVEICHTLGARFMQLTYNNQSLLATGPIAITHANPAQWHPARRNKSDDILKALAASGGMIGFSLYPHHLKDKSQCSIESFCEMIARTAELMGVEQLGLGSDLCQDQPDSVVEWMRVGRWTKQIDYGEGSAKDAGFPPMPSWFQDNRDFSNIETGLRSVGFSEQDVAGIMGENWLRFYDQNFSAL